MTPKEFRAEANKLQHEMGTLSPHIWCCVDHDGQLSASVCANWPRNSDEAFTVKADNFNDLSAKMWGAWTVHAARLRAESIENMALEIINATARYGECNEAHLRLKFSQQEIRQLGAAAIERANIIGHLGPFSITATEKANAA